MTLDERMPIVEHRALRDDEPEWRRLARKTEAEERAYRRAEYDEWEAQQDPDAIEARWREIFAAQPAWLTDQVWDDDRRIG